MGFLSERVSASGLIAQTGFVDDGESHRQRSIEVHRVLWPVVRSVEPGGRPPPSRFTFPKTDISWRSLDQVVCAPHLFCKVTHGEAEDVGVSALRMSEATFRSH